MTGEQNGTQERVAETLMEDVTVGYRPQLPLETLWMAGGGDMPQITMRRDLEFMQLHPVVIAALEYYKSGISGAEFWGGPDHKDTTNDKGRPISPDDRVSQFVLAHVERFWQRGVPVFQEGGYPYGWAPGEHIYKENSGMLVWSHMKGFHPNDSYVLTHALQPVGIRIKNIKNDLAPATTLKTDTAGVGMTDLWFASENIPAKAAWYTHRPRFNQFYGRSQLMGSWRPWRRLGWRDAVEQVIDAAIYRAGYRGPIVRHPMEDMQTSKTGIPATTPDSRGGLRRSAQDVARQMVEYLKAGGGVTMSSAQYPPSQGGGLKWDIDWPEHVMDVRPLIEGARYLEDQVMLGAGVPPELIRAGGTGSGYSGRSIPREAFLDQQQRIADAMLQGFVEQVIKPLVMWNFGDVPFEVSCKPLLLTQAANKQGEGAAKDPLPQQQQPKQQGNQPPPTPRQAGGGEQQGVKAFSMDDPLYRRALDVVQDVMRRRRAA